MPLRVLNIEDSQDDALRRECKQAKRVHHGDQKTNERLAEEMSALAEIGRLISSTLDIEEVYERVAVDVKKLIPFDRLVVSLNKPQENVRYIAYISGLDVPGRRVGDTYPLEESMNGMLSRLRTGVLIQSSNIGEISARYPGLIDHQAAGMRSMMSVPLISRDTVIGGLHFRSKQENAYSEQDLQLAEMIGEQISGAVANAQLYADLKETEKSLRESEERFRTIADYTVDWEMWIGPHRRLLWINPSVERITGYSVEECLNSQDYPLFIVHPEDRPIIAEYLENAFRGGKGSNLEFRFLRKDGALRWGAVSWQPVFGEQGASLGHRSSIRDVTNRRRMQEENALRSKQLATLYETSLELTAELNLDALLQSIAQRALNLIGGTSCNCYLYKPETDLLERVVSAGSALISSKKTRQRGEGLTGKVWETGAPLLVNDYRLWEERNTSHDPFPSHAVVGVPVCCENEFLGVINIMAELPRRFTQADIEMLGMFATQAAMAIRNARMYNIIEQCAVTDELTGLFNRRGFFQLGEREFERAMRFGRPLAALMFDIDHFKKVNDTHGHLVGDQVLRAVADCFRQNTRGIDVAGRYGGEEFVLLLPETLLAGVIQFAERLRQTIADLAIPVCQTDGDSPTTTARVTVSVGVASMMPDVSNLNALINRTDQALFRAKRSGRNRVAAWEEAEVLNPAKGGGCFSLDAAGLNDRGEGRSDGGKNESVPLFPEEESWGFGPGTQIRSDNPGGQSDEAARFGEEDNRRRLQEALRESEDRFVQFMRHLPGRACIKDADGRFLFLNEGFRRALGIDPDVWVGKTSADMWSPETAAVIRREDKEALAGKIVKEESERPGLKPGETTWWLSYRFPIYRVGKPALIGVLATDMTDFRRTKEVLERTTENLRSALGSIVQTLSMTTEIRDPYTAGHQRRVADLAGEIVVEMGCGAALGDGIRMAGMIHDIGKISIPAEILSKPTKLAEIELRLIRLHPRAAYDILLNIKFTWPIAEIIQQHHERMDGSGYPLGLKGDEILPEARILAVADVVEAMASHRPYRAGLGLDVALAEIAANRRSLYDERVVDACLKVFAKGYQLPTD